MSNLILYPHLGLGDFMINNGLVRKICSSSPNDNFTIVTKPTGFNTIKFMFKDVPNLKVVSLKSGDFSFPENSGEVYQYAKLNNLEIVKIGHEFLSFEAYFDKAFYKQFNIDFSNRWTNFFVLRDEIREKKLASELNPNEEKIAIIHNESGDGVDRLNYSVLNDSLKKIFIKPGHTDNAFDYLGLLSRAKEIHCVDSSFKHLFDSFDLGGIELFYHDTPRRNKVYRHEQKNDWKLV